MFGPKTGPSQAPGPASVFAVECLFWPLLSVSSELNGRARQLCCVGVACVINIQYERQLINCGARLSGAPHSSCRIALVQPTHTQEQEDLRQHANKNRSCRSLQTKTNQIEPRRGESSGAKSRLIAEILLSCITQTFTKIICQLNARTKPQHSHPTTQPHNHPIECATPTHTALSDSSVASIRLCVQFAQPSPLWVHEPDNCCRPGPDSSAPGLNSRLGCQ